MTGLSPTKITALSSIASPFPPLFLGRLLILSLQYIGEGKVGLDSIDFHPKLLALLRFAHNDREAFHYGYTVSRFTQILYLHIQHIPPPHGAGEQLLGHDVGLG